MHLFPFTSVYDTHNGTIHFISTLFSKSSRHSTKLTPSLQEVFSLWNTKILPFLPKHLETIAQQHQLFQRKRTLTSAFDMLRMFFLFASSGISLRMLSVADASLGIATMSDTAWRKKLLPSLSFLQQVLQIMLQTMIPKPLSKQQRRVLLVDGSVVRLQGKQQHQERVHLCYSLTENRMQQIKVTDYHTAETLSIFDFSRQDIVLADAGFETVKNYAFALQQGADVILRITPKRFPLFDAQGNQLDIVSILKEAEKKKERVVEVMILLWLLIWMITERQAIQIERILQEKKEETGQSTILSCWEQCRYAYFQIKEILCFSWSLFVDFTNPNLTRLLATHSGKRKNQNQEFRSLILPGLIL